MNRQLAELLDHLSEVLCPQRLAEIEDLNTRSLSYEAVERLPLILQYPLPGNFPFQPYAHREIFADPEKMLFNELVCAYGGSIACRRMIDDDLPCTVRVNFGTVLISAMFGGRIEQVDDNPPWVRHFETIDEFRECLDIDPTDFSRGWCPRVVDFYRAYHEILSQWPELMQMTRIVLPDLQSPLDNADLLRGSEIYLDMYTEPELVDRAMHTLAVGQVGFAKYLAPYLTDCDDGWSHQHGMMMKGNMLMRNDSAIMVSPEMYRRQIFPHDEFVLGEMGGGGFHACGCLDHNTPEVLQLPSITSLDLGQPEMNDLDMAYRLASARNIPMLRVSVSEDELTSGRVMDRFPTGVSLLHKADSFADALRIWDQYNESAAKRS